VLALLAVLAVHARGTMADIRMTPHSLVRNDPAGIRGEDREVCVFCHTPAVSAGTPPARAPQWQAAVGRDYTYTIYDDIGRLGLDRQSVGSQSIACLSCHDANQALSAGRTSNDHPFGVPYRGAIKDRARRPGLPGPLAAPTADVPPHIHAKRLVALEDFRDASQGIVEDRTVWWVSSSGMTARRSRSDLPLYARLDDESGEVLPHIECSSCHDPHSPNQLFLRTSNDGSALCLTCHIK
jgi:predicted CXXCH cytochrome family protein